LPYLGAPYNLSWPGSASSFGTGTEHALVDRVLPWILLGELRTLAHTHQAGQERALLFASSQEEPTHVLSRWTSRSCPDASQKLIIIENSTGTMPSLEQQ